MKYLYMEIYRVENEAKEFVDGEYFKFDEVLNAEIPNCIFLSRDGIGFDLSFKKVELSEIPKRERIDMKCLIDGMDWSFYDGHSMKIRNLKLEW